jgi:hypothetical protein
MVVVSAEATKVSFGLTTIACFMTIAIARLLTRSQPEFIFVIPTARSTRFTRLESVWVSLAGELAD